MSAPEFRNQKELDEYKQHVAARADERLLALRLGPRTKEMGKVPLPTTGAWAYPAKAAAGGFKLAISGTPGAGKTTLAKRLAWGLALRRWKPRGGYLPDILDRIKSPEVGEFMEWVRGGDLLVLDDLDKLRGTHYEGERILAILNHYDSNKLPIIYTLNVSMSAFKERMTIGGIPEDYVESIISRLTGRMEPFMMNEPDHRQEP